MNLQILYMILNRNVIGLVKTQFFSWQTFQTDKILLKLENVLLYKVYILYTDRLPVASLI